MAKKKDEVQVQQTEQIIPEVYSNAGMVNFTPYEFEVTMGLGSSNYEGVRPVVNLRMSPQFMKEFAELLQANVKQYEERFGDLGASEESRIVN